MAATADIFTQISEGLEHVVQKYDIVTTSDLGPEDVRVVYDHWADQYDKDKSITAATEVKIYKTFVETVFEACLADPNIKILDVGAGTGRLGLKLKEAGFSNIDGIDGSAKMLEACKQRGIYRNLYLLILGENPVPIESGYYDLLVSIGSFLTNHITEACLEELIRITKPGGNLVIAMHYGVGDPGYPKRFVAKVDRLESEGLWRVRGRKGFQEEVSDFRATFFSIQKFDNDACHSKIGSSC